MAVPSLKRKMITETKQIKIMQRALSLLLGILLALLLAACGGPTLPETGDRAIESGHNEAAPPEETSAAALSSVATKVAETSKLKDYE